MPWWDEDLKEEPCWYRKLEDGKYAVSGSEDHPYDSFDELVEDVKTCYQSVGSYPYFIEKVD